MFFHLLTRSSKSGTRACRTATSIRHANCLLTTLLADVGGLGAALPGVRGTECGVRRPATIKCNQDEFKELPSLGRLLENKVKITTPNRKSDDPVTEGNMRQSMSQKNNVCLGSNVRMKLVARTPSDPTVDCSASPAFRPIPLSESGFEQTPASHLHAIIATDAVQSSSNQLKLTRKPHIFLPNVAFKVKHRCCMNVLATATTIATTTTAIIAPSELPCPSGHQRKITPSSPTGRYTYTSYVLTGYFCCFQVWSLETFNRRRCCCSFIPAAFPSQIHMPVLWHEK
ncbi:hypothetical protein TcWFU_000555 [Taenia crassiceps]|uniref:Uncharacterized protein n=1 Tax=Taenia crassiceps TaxID=6207 RepID=A0ABR4QF08_9CEST